MTQEKFLDKLLDVFYSKDKTKLILFGLVFLSFILRIIAALNLSMAADDTHFAVHAINFLSSNKLVTYDQSAPLWFAHTSVLYSIFGTTQLASRIPAILFGTFSILVIFLLTREFFSKRTALIAALLLTISPFHIKNTLSEMDNTVMFFVMFGTFIFIKALHSDKKNHYFFLGGILLGLAVLTKVYALLFIPVLLCYSFYFNYKKNNKIINKELAKKLAIFLLAIFIFCIPSLAHNYLLYKDKGFMDFIYTNTLGIGREKAAQYYSWDAGWGHKMDLKGFFFGNSKYTGKSPSSIVALGFLYKPDPIIFILGLIGLIYCFFKKREFLIWSLLILGFLFIYFASRILLSKHYIFLLFVFIPPAAEMLSIFSKSIKNKLKSFKLKYLFIVLIIFSLIFLGLSTTTVMTHFYSKSSIAQVMDSKKSFSKNSLVVADSRIYRGQIHWMLNNENYIESAYFPQLVQLSENSSEKVLTDVYFIECVQDDCGWGTIKDQPEFNQTMEAIVLFFQDDSRVIREVYVAENTKPYFPFISDGKKLEFRIYKKSIVLDQRVLSSVKTTHTFFMYPVGYDRSIHEIFDDYQVLFPLDKLLHGLSKAIIYLAVFLSIFYLFFIVYLIIEDET